MFLSDRPKRVFFKDLARLVPVIVRLGLLCFEAIPGVEDKGNSCDRFIWATGGEVELLLTTVGCRESFMTSRLVDFQSLNLKRRIFDWLLAIWNGL